MELEESTFLTSDYITNLQSSKENGTRQKQKYRPMEQDTKSKINPHTYGYLIFDKGCKIVSSVSGPANTGQLYLKEEN